MDRVETVKIAGLDVPRYHEDPGWIPETKLILTPTTRRNLQKILHPLMHGYNLLLVGDAGVGKNALIYYINQLRRHPTVRYSFNEDTLPEDLVGAYRIDPTSHGFVWADGPLAHAMRSGATFVADEMNLAPPEVLKRFYSVFTDRMLQILEGDSTEVQAGPAFNFVATQNPAEGFEGRKNLPREIQKYFATIYVDPYPHDELVEILHGLYPSLQRDAVDGLVKANDGIERLVLERKVGAADLERYHFNIRNLSRLARRVSQSSTDGASAELADIYVRPFRKDDDRRAIHENLKESLNDANIHWPEAYNEEASDDIVIHVSTAERSVRVGRAFIDFQGGETDDIAYRSSVRTAFEDFPPVSAARPVLEAVARAVEMGENVLLECEADVEPEDYVHFFSDLAGKRLAVITLSRGMHTADVLGGLKPSGDDPMKGGDAVRWVDGPLTAAVRRGDYILLKGLEAAGPELVEKLNMLLDDARALMLPPESGETEPLKLTEDARIFAQKFFRLQRSTPSISRAFRNRFSAIVVEPITGELSLREIVQSRLGLDEEPDAEAGAAAGGKIVGSMVKFHATLREQSAKREIGSGNIQPYQFGLTNLRRWCEHVRAGLSGFGEGGAENPEGHRKELQQLILRGAGVAYINEISDPRERDRAAVLLDNLLSGLPIEELLEAFRAASKKKS